MHASHPSSGGKFSEIAYQSNCRYRASFFFSQLFDLYMIYSLTEEQLPQRFYDFRNINALGTPGVAGHAGLTNPNGPGLQQLGFQTELGKPDDLIWQNIHLSHRRTTR